jgi:predicted nucleic acid-binding protein
MPAVSNASPLIVFSRIGELNLIGRAYGTVLVPPAVWREVVEEGADRPGAAGVAGVDWLRRVDVAPSGLLTRMRPRLGAGEAEAIALASERAGTIPLLLDDLDGRRVAGELRLPVVGSAGVLVAAKKLGLIESARPLLAELRSAGLYLSDRVFTDALVLVGEAPADVE